MKNMIIRTATANDAEAILNIYAYYVENTAITFEYEVPSLEEFEQRILKTLEKYSGSEKPHFKAMCETESESSAMSFSA